MAGGVVGFLALVSPWGIPLGLAIAALGTWMVRSTAATNAIGLPVAV